MKQTNTKLQTETLETRRLQLVHYKKRKLPTQDEM